jgi:spore coat polysaccharide biosynthesis predicted glycosyltransferase SpsG
MTKRRVLFRADAEPSIGTGDLMSLIHLSKYFRSDNWDCYFLIKDYPTAIRLAEDNGLNNVSLIDRNFSLTKEIDLINNMTVFTDISLLFFEITKIKLSSYQGLIPGVPKACVSFDGEILEEMDLVVDWDVDAYKFFQPERHPQTKFLLGPEYVILPLNYDHNRIAARNFITPPKRLLVCMGGADEQNFTQKIVDALLDSDKQLESIIILGAGYQYKAHLEKSLSGSKSKFTVKENVLNMFKEYMECDLAIGAGGLIASELVATRTPSILLATYQHQISRCQYFDDRGWARYLGYKEFARQDLLEAIEHIQMPAQKPVFNTRAILEACNEIIQ